METVRVREKTDDKIIFASMRDMMTFFDQVFNGQGVIFDYVPLNNGFREGEYISPEIANSIQDGRMKVMSKEGVE